MTSHLSELCRHHTADSPVEVASFFSDYLQGFSTIPGGWQFFFSDYLQGFSTIPGGWQFFFSDYLQGFSTIPGGWQFFF